MAKKPQAYELVLWEDPATDWDGWTDVDAISVKQPELVYSIGWPVRDDDIYLYLAMDWHNEEINTLGKIPKAAIKARKRIQLRGFPPKEKKKETWTHQMVNDPAHPEGTEVVVEHDHADNPLGNAGVE
jgi:hypothetical protein